MKKFSLLVYAMLVLILTNGCGKEETLTLKDNLDVEINSEVKLSSLVKEDSKLELINGEQLVDTSSLGKSKVTIKYKNNKKKDKELSFEVNVIDTKVPVIDCKDVINTKVGVKVDLVKQVKVTDNSKETIIPKVEGSYDFNKIGKYSITFVATDTSGNVASKKVTLVVSAPTIKTSGYYVLKPKSSGVWEYVQLKKDKTIDYLIWPCAPEACGFFTRMGTYKVDGNNLTITLTHEQPDVGYKEKLSKPVVMKFTIVSEKQISYKGSKYNWQSNFN